MLSSLISVVGLSGCTCQTSYGTLVQNEELATRWLKILATIGFSSDLLLNMSNFDWLNYKWLKLTINLVTS